MEKKIVHVGSLALGDGNPKICVPLTAGNLVQMESQLEKIRAVPCDMIELRADYYEGDPIEELAAIRERMPDMPVLFTLRTKEEGGERAISPEEYARLNLRAAGVSDVLSMAGVSDVLSMAGVSDGPGMAEMLDGMHRAAAVRADLIDLELNRGEEFVRNLAARLQSTGVKIIISYHDFTCTPDKENLVHLLGRMQSLGADITKAAVMPQCERDVLTLLSAAVTMKEQAADRPYIVMSMGRLGAVSRLAGHLTGSAVTFATAGAASAPGQMDAGFVARALELL
ncbi:MAG: type I 3-dehydroquinate dehydratase [Lachnospiraceae bacterium]|nr:type I 3-dehydroquinate dehydratase [Lachnospiraceae bacterium]